MLMTPFLYILPAEDRQLFHLKCLLRSFNDSTGLHVNINKSFLVLINLSDDKCLHLSRTFGCWVSPMPFTYLGLPLRTTRPTFQDFTPLLSEIENSLMGVSRYLSYHGRLILVNSVFSAMLTFYMCTLKLQPRVIDEIDKYRKHTLWSGAEIHRAGSCLATWDTTCRPKEEGGLGIICLQSKNIALLLKFLDKFYIIMLTCPG